MDDLYGVSADLQEIVRFGLAGGNEVVRVDRPAGTKSPLGIVFKQSLRVSDYVEKHGLPETVDTWENRDPHYDLARGYISRASRHAVWGPL